MKQSYSGAFGRLKAMSIDFLTNEQLYELARAKDVAEVAQRLEATWYKADIEESAAVHKVPELIEFAVNSHIADLNKIALSVTPSSGKPILVAYLAKWDIENIELILAAKSLGRSREETEAFLVPRPQPARRRHYQRHPPQRAPRDAGAAGHRRRDKLTGAIRLRSGPPPAARGIQEVRRPGGILGRPAELLLLEAALAVEVHPG